MALDFCLPHLLPRIYSDKVSVDGHEIMNLISENPFVKSKGFLAERFIKPPVQITVAFPCNIDIQKIVIDPIVGSQKSCGFEIMTRSDPVKHSWILNEKVPLEKSPHVEGMFVSVGRCTREYTGHALFVFTNRSYRSKSSFSMDASQDIDCSGANVISYEMRHHRNISLASVSHVLIRITRTQGSCIPCMKSVAIFGQPAHSVPKPIINRIRHLNVQFCEAQRKEIDVTPKKTESEETVIKVDFGKQPEDEIPKEFIDPITCDIMTIPLLLPSGHSIDKTTLERHVTEEEKWGRTPNDPFTGVVFHGSSQPIPNSSLKVRIDQFLVKSGILFKNVARTVGRSSDILNQDVTFSSVYNSAITAHDDVDSDCEIVESPAKTVAGADFKLISEAETNYVGKVHKRKSDSEIAYSAGKKRKEPPLSIKSPFLGPQRPRVTACHRLPFASGITNRTMEFTRTTHEKNLSNSLDSALSLTLGNLPSFRKSTAGKETAGNVIRLSTMCIMCNSDLRSDKIVAYTLPCAHKLCRGCLLSETKLSNEVICKGCLSNCSSKDIKKTYVT